MIPLREGDLRQGWLLTTNVAGILLSSVES